MSAKREGVLVLLKGEVVQIFDKGITMNSNMVDWESDNEEDILEEYFARYRKKKRGGER